MGGALIGATLVELGAGERGNLGLQQVLEPTAHDLWDQGTSGGALHELSQLGGATMGGSWFVFGLVVVLRTGSQTGPPWGPHPLPQQRTEGGEPSAPATPGLLLLSYTTPWGAA
jgi:hypothetical protein